MHASLTCLSFLMVSMPLLAEERGLRFTATKDFLPKLQEIAVVKANDPGPNAPKYKAIATTAKYEEIVKLDEEGPYDIWWSSKEGSAVRVLANVKLTEKKVKSIQIDHYLGVVTIRGDELPRAGLVTITSQDDSGPDEKSHIPIQSAKEYRVEMVVPEGFYALWITPENGGRAKKVNDRFRVIAGKVITIE
jgi:hypothetical protein